MERRHLLLIVGVFIALVGVALVFAAYFPTPQRVLKQNLYKRTFTDHPLDLLSLDVIINYETEADGTWRMGSQVEYNITVLVKLTYVNESVLSKVKVIYWEVSGLGSGESQYLPAESTPLDFGIDLMGFWSNQSAWCAVRKLYRPYIVAMFSPPPDHWDISYHFLIREILSDGASNIFNAGDFLSFAISK